MPEYDLRAVAFPTLDEKQISQLGTCTRTSVARVPAGHVLFQVGDRDFRFFVVKSGEIAILDPATDPPTTVAVHGPGQFTGDVGHLTGSPALVNAVARVESEVLEVTSPALKQALDRCPELSDIVLQAFIARRQVLRQPGTFVGPRVIGSRHSGDTFRIRDFLARNRVPFTWLDLETNLEVDRLLEQFGISRVETPVVALPNRKLLRNPSNRELADAFGIRKPLAQTMYDLAVVGAGPAGLGAAVYGASEGLRTLVLERMAPGGQAGSSMRIENYLGFPAGVSGSELADRAVIQANRFGALLSVPVRVTGLGFDQGYSVLQIEDGASVSAKCLLIATGAHYRRLVAEGCEPFEGRGVYYAATPTEAIMCQGSEAVVVGAGNSAGQAAVFLAAHCRKVHLLVRGKSLHDGMSSYLAARIEQTPNIEVSYHTVVERMVGDACLRAVEVLDQRTGEKRTLHTPGLFCFIGAVPHTDWLPAEIQRDDKGFVRTGAALVQPAQRVALRPPVLLETNQPGVFAAGDVRSGSVKRVASAVGEGSMAIQFVHEYLRQM
jgi:thioredoxin reductase (NADPH)